VKSFTGAGALLVISAVITEAARTLGAEARSITVDISDPEQVKAGMEFGRINGFFTSPPSLTRRSSMTIRALPKSIVRCGSGFLT
jgi:hypothetical protein